MSNSFSSSLVVDTATAAAITTLGTKLAPAKAFSSDFTEDVVYPLRTLQVGVVTAAADAIISPTSFESNGTTMGNAPVSMTHISAQFGLTSAQLNQGFKLEKILAKNLQKMANALMDTFLTPLSTSNFGAAVYNSAVTVATGGVLGNDLITKALPTLRTAISNGTEKILVLDGSYYSYLIPQSGFNLNIGGSAYGFDKIYENNRWNAVTGGSDANLNGATVGSAGTKSSTLNYLIKGFAVSPEAIALATALPIIDPAVMEKMLISETIQIEGLGLAVQFNVWGSTTNRGLYGSFDIVAGSAAADTSALKFIVG